MKEVICIKTHSRGVVIEGNTYYVLSTMNVVCQCGPQVLYNVGIVGDPKAYTKCLTCGTRRLINSPMYWINSKLFADVADISELKEILNKQTANGAS